MLINVAPLIRILDQVMVDTCLIERQPDAQVFDTATGLYVPQDPVQVYRGPCYFSSLRTRIPSGSLIDQGGASTVETRLWVNLPLTFKADLEPKDIVTALRSVTSQLQGMQFTMEEVMAPGTYAVTRRLFLHEYVRVPTNG